MTTPTPDNKKRLLKIAGAVILIVIICLVIAVMVFGVFPASPQKNTSLQNVSPVSPITPPTGASGTLVPVTIEGTAFAYGPSPSVWLSKTGEPDITAAYVNVISKTQLTCTFPLPASYSSAGQWDVFVKNAGEQTGSKIGVFTVENRISPPMTWSWPVNGWAGWQNTTTCVGSATEACSAYGPVLETGYGVYGSKLTEASGSSTKSTVTKTFTAASGERWNTLTFSGLLSPSENSYSRSLTINVNGLNVYSATAEKDPVINGSQFTITRTFSPANMVTVKITTKQDPIIGNDYNTLQFDSMSLS